MRLRGPWSCIATRSPEREAFDSVHGFSQNSPSVRQSQCRDSRTSSFSLLPSSSVLRIYGISVLFVRNSFFSCTMSPVQKPYSRFEDVPPKYLQLTESNLNQESRPVFHRDERCASIWKLRSCIAPTREDPQCRHHGRAIRNSRRCARE